MDEKKMEALFRLILENQIKVFQFMRDDDYHPRDRMSPDSRHRLLSFQIDHTEQQMELLLASQS